MRRAAVFFLLAGASCALGLASACRSTEGPTGVHVAVSLAPGWSDTDAFDHVTVVARGGGRTAVVCLSPQAGAASAFALDASPDAAADPCAEDVRTAWQTLPTTTSWKLDEKPRTINIEGFAEGDSVTVTADARLGGSAVVGQAAGVAAAAVGTASLGLALVRGATTTVCTNVALGTALVGDASTPGLVCRQESSTCLCDLAGRGSATDATCTGYAQGTTCVDGGLVVDPTSIAAGCADHDVVRSVIGTSRNCIEVGVLGHLYGCADAGTGTCVPTTDCDPTELALRVRTANGGASVQTSLGCIPPLAFDVPFVVTIAGGDFGVFGGGLLGLEAEPSTSPRACRVGFTILGASDCPK